MKSTIIILFTYAAFWFWYTPSGGPLTNEEIRFYLDQIDSDEGRAQVEAFAREDTGRSFYMLNALDLDESPGSVEGAPTGADGQQLMDLYMEHMLPALLARASHPAFFGTAVGKSIEVVGVENAETWDTGALVRYRSRKDLLDIVTNPDFRGRHHFKVAALEKTIAYPIETPFNPGDPRLLFGLIAALLISLSIRR
ncbi:hypothetical protein OMB55_00021110 [gamma proteobacterium HIMB55]|nr:hypothetical protein OMB55_00021110 [gamma proteobacterium HIMB55]